MCGSKRERERDSSVWLQCRIECVISQRNDTILFSMEKLQFYLIWFIVHSTLFSICSICSHRTDNRYTYYVCAKRASEKRKKTTIKKPLINQRYDIKMMSVIVRLTIEIVHVWTECSFYIVWNVWLFSIFLAWQWCAHRYIDNAIKLNKWFVVCVSNANISYNDYRM